MRNRPKVDLSADGNFHHRLERLQNGAIPLHDLVVEILRPRRTDGQNQSVRNLLGDSGVPAPDAGSPATENGTDVAQLQQPPARPAEGAQSQSEAALEAEPLADYTGDQSRPKPPETLQPAHSPAFVTAVPDVVAGRSSVTPIGYVEKAGGEKEAIVEYQDQVFLVHEGELFAGKYRVLRLTALSVEIVEEPTEASSAAIDRRRKVQVVPESR